ncbi:MAG: gamma-glutamyltransferase [Polyangiaceae bacterium]|nr:gamma-glutamyltransferase [Polyangiaceae bacterium]
MITSSPALSAVLRWAPTTLLLAIGACAARPPATSRAGAPSGAAVATENATASHIAMEILKRGGRAADAAVAAAFALGVAVPVSSGIGGGGVALTWDARAKRLSALDFRETAPSGAVAAELEDAPPLGALVGVPGEVAGLLELHAREGSRPLAELVEPAATLAERGFPISPHLARALDKMSAHARRSPVLAQRFFVGSAPLAAGAVATNPELGRTLRAIAARGRDAFYTGETAGKLADAVAREGGHLTAADLAAYRVVERVPVRVRRGDRELATMPPPSGGGLMLAQLATMFPPGDPALAAPDSAAWMHALAEAMRGSFADRLRKMGDPAFADVDVSALAAPERMRARRAAIDPDKTRGIASFVAEEHGTSHLVVVDREGSIVTLTTTVNGPFGARIVAGDTGVLLNDELGDFVRQKHASKVGVKDPPGGLRPGARPPTSMCPTIVFDGERPTLALGGSGGFRIATGVTQVALRVLSGATADAAVRAPRFHVPPDGSLVLEEGRADAATRTDLARRGERVKESDAPAAVQAIELLHGSDGVTPRPVADPRKFGLALAEERPLRL